VTAVQITDYTPWDLRDKFKDQETAYLWFDLEPSYGNDHPNRVTGMLLALREAEKRGELTNQTPYRSHPSGVLCIPATHYSRPDLRRYADKHHQRPLFLFPECRSAVAPVAIGLSANDKLASKSESSLLKMLDAALSLQYGNDWAGADVETFAHQWTKDLELNGLPIPVERRAMIKWLTRILGKHRQ
jgi:hypothetical protein